MNWDYRDLESKASVDKRQRNIARILTGGAAEYGLLTAVSGVHYWNDWQNAYDKIISQASSITPQVIEHARNAADIATSADPVKIAASAILATLTGTIAYCKHKQNRDEQPEFYKMD